MAATPDLIQVIAVGESKRHANAVAASERTLLTIYAHQRYGAEVIQDGDLRRSLSRE
jgi:hypothetical protein